MFEERDMIFLLRDEPNPSATSWRDVLRPYGLRCKVTTALTPPDPLSAPLLDICY